MADPERLADAMQAASARLQRERQNGNRPGRWLTSPEDWD